MNWNTLSTILKNLYNANNVPQNKFKSDELYLRRAFYGIEYFWLTQYLNLKDIRYVMISEAPLWGDTDAYFYNPNFTGNARFFSNKDLNYILKLNTTTRPQMINVLNKIGFLVLDVFPFAFNNKKGTATKYQYDYKTLMGLKGINTFLNDIFNSFLMHKLDLIASKRGEPIKFFYRYNKVVPPIKQEIELRLLQKALIPRNQMGSLPSVHSNPYHINQTILSTIIP